MDMMDDLLKAGIVPAFHSVDGGVECSLYITVTNPSWDGEFEVVAVGATAGDALTKALVQSWLKFNSKNT
jgi:hypothetical protein